MRNAFIYTLTTLCFGTTGCSKTVVNLDGQINGHKVNGAAHWGGHSSYSRTPTWDARNWHGSSPATAHPMNTK